MISYIVQIFFRIIYLIILVAVLLSWVPIFDTRKEPFLTIDKLYHIFTGPFKAIIPPIGMLDISPLAAFIFYQIAERVIVTILMRFGL